jgi:DNA gyrase subunit A
VKRTHPSAYRAQKRGGKGKVGMEARDEDWVSQLFVASTHSFVFFFSDKGKAYVKKVYEIPEGARNAKGRAIVNFVGMEPGEKVAAITPVPGFDPGWYVVTLTRRGQIKKTAVEEYENYREKGIIGVKIEEGDELSHAAITDGSRELIIATRTGMSIRFSEKDVRSMGRATVGEKGVELEEGDSVVGLCVVRDENERVLAVCERGYGKQTALDEFRLQSRGGKGVILIDASDRNGPVVGLNMVGANHEVLLVTDKGQMLRIKAADIRETGRNAQGVKLMNVEDEERIVAIEVFEEEQDTSSTPPPSGEPPPSDAPPAGANGASDANGTTDGSGSNGSNGST